MIKNAITYSVVMPQTAGEMGDFIDKSGLLTRKPSEQEVRTLGFAKHPVSGSFITAFPGGYCIVIREWEKKIKASVVRQLVQDRIDALGYTPTKKDKVEIKDDVVIGLVSRIPAESKDHYVYYSVESKKLIVDTTSQKVADLCTSLLRKSIGSLLAKTLYVDQSNGLTQKLVKHLDYNDTNTSFTGDIHLDSEATLVLKGYTGQALSYKNLDLYEEGTTCEIVDMVKEKHMFVGSIALETESTSFTLTEGFKLKSIKHGDFDTSFNKDDVDEWAGAVMYCMNQVCSITDTLVKEFTVVEETSSIPVPPGV